MTQKEFKILFIGDIVARQGRRVVRGLLPQLKEELGVDLTIANGENLTTGHGLTKKAVDDMHSVGIDIFTSGNHVWRKEEFIPELDRPEATVIRPANYPKGTPGVGWRIVETCIGKIAVMNLIGKEGIRVVKYEWDNPFLVVDEVLAEIKKEDPVAIIVDFHAEWTSEKVAMAFNLDGKVSAVLSTHTHIPTADARILPGGTAYVSDVGMVGPLNSVLGVETEIIIDRFKNGTPRKFEIANGQGVFNSVLLTLDTKGAAKKIERVDRFEKS